VCDLPGREARCTQQVSTRLNANVLIVLGTDLTQLERRAHLTVELVLLLGHANVVLGRVMNQETEVRRRHIRLTVGVEIAT